jgi:hypothetical protein
MGCFVRLILAGKKLCFFSSLLVRVPALVGLAQDVLTSTFATGRGGF